MKKMMMGASALVIAGASGAAVAQEWDVSVGGGVVIGGAYVDTSVVRHNEMLIHRVSPEISASIVADNGLTFGGFLVLLSDGNGDLDTDGFGGTVSGSFGQVQIGTHSGAQRSALPRVPRTAFTAAGRGGGILFDGEYARSEVPAGVGDDRGGNTGFSNKVTYLTPRVAGFRGGISYAPRGESNVSGTNLNSTRENEGIEFGLNYSGDFSGFAVQLGGGYTTFLNDGPNDAGWNIGGQVGFQGFAVGVTYGYTDRNNNDDVATLAVGATYRTGPWAFGLNYGWNVKGDAGNGTTTTRTREDDYGISFGVDYALAPGVLLGGALEYSKADQDVTSPSGTSDDAFAAGVFLGLNF